MKREIDWLGEYGELPVEATTSKEWTVTVQMEVPDPCPKNPPS